MTANAYIEDRDSLRKELVALGADPKLTIRLCNGGDVIIRKMNLPNRPKAREGFKKVLRRHMCVCVWSKEPFNFFEKTSSRIQACTVFGM